MCLRGSPDYKLSPSRNAVRRVTTSMIIYSVTIAVEVQIEARWLEWMNAVHIPDVLRTRCFSAARIYEAVDAADANDERTYVIQYDCHSLEEYHRYRDHFAAALQKEHSDRFAGRFRGSRQVLRELDRAQSGDELRG
jgi:hypothetical protein